MQVGMVDIDGKIPNLALMKLSKHHKNKEHQVELVSPLFASQYDLVYASKVFSYTPMTTLPEHAVVGGSGIDLENKLDDEIESLKPDYDLYIGMTYSLGFTTRGCIRRCPFCIVPEKEGRIKEVADLYDIWDKRHKKIVLLDNNVLALPEHFEKIMSQIKKEGLVVDWNQGLDHRLLSDRICKTLKSTPHVEYRFAFDDIRMKPTVDMAVSMLRKHGINRCEWFVLVGFDSTFQEDLERVNFLRDRNQNAYVQRYNRTKDPKYIPLARWVNQHHLFQAMTWEQFLLHPDNKSYAHLLDGARDIIC